MPPENISETFPFKKLSWYPHMGPEDVAIWERAIAEFPSMYKSVQYDVPCGTGPPFDTLVNEETGGHSERLYKRKIDVVGVKGDRIDIIEVKPHAGPSAIGQVKMNRDLYIRDYKPAKFPKAVIITDSTTPDVADFAINQGVQIVVV